METDGGSGVDPSSGISSLLAVQWGTTPWHVNAVFKRFASRPDGDTALRRLDAVRGLRGGPYVVLDLASGVHVVPYTSAHTSWAQTAFLTLAEAFREARKLAAWS